MSQATVLDAWNNTVTGSANAATLSTILSLLYFGGLILMGAWLLSGLFDAFKKGDLTASEAMWYIGRYLVLFIFTTFYFVK